MTSERLFIPAKASDLKDVYRVGVLAPHPDDEILGCGGTLTILHSLGRFISVAVVTDGQAHGDQKESSAGLTRRDESMKAAQCLGINPPTFWGFEDRTLFEIDGLGSRIDDWIHRHSLTHVFAPHPWEMHPDHRAIAMAVIEALTKEGNDQILFWGYEVSMPLAKVDVLVDITDVADKKTEAVECFGTQLEKQRYAEQIAGLNSYRSYTLGTDVLQAEAFVSIDRQVEGVVNSGDIQSANELVRSFDRELAQNSEKYLMQIDTLQAALTSRLDDIKTERKAFEHERKAFERRIDDVSEELSNVYSSKSWRYTAPLRSFLACLRKIKATARSLPSRDTLRWIKDYLRQLIKKNTVAVRFYRWGRQLARRVNIGLDNHENLKALDALRLYRQNRHHNGPPIPLWRMLPDTESLVDVTIITFNSEQHIRPLIESLAYTSSYSTKCLAIWLHDNGSSDQTVNLCEVLRNELGALFAGFNISCGDNVGFGAAQNDIIRRGRAPLVLIINPDCVVHQNTISRLVAMANVETEEFAVFEPRQFPYEHPKHYDPVSWETNWNSHACVLVKRAIFELMNGYDETFFLYCEDVEFSYRLRDAGYRLKYCPHATVEHNTYTEPGEIKTQQAIGSLLGNIAIRLKFGKVADQLAIIPLLMWSFSTNRTITNVVFSSLVRNALTWLRYQPSGSVHFPLRHADFELRRDGAFYAQPFPETKDNVSVVTRTTPERISMLRDAMYSVLNQTHDNIEWVIAQDGGEPIDLLELGVPEELMPMVVLIVNPKVGRSVAGNRGLSKAKGSWVKWLDDDDWLYADDLEALVNADTDAKVRYGNAWTIPSEVGETGVWHEILPFIDSNLYPPELNMSVLSDRNCVPIQSPLFDKSLASQLPEELDYLEDWVFWRDLASRASGVRIEKTLSGFRIPIDNDRSKKRQRELDRAYWRVKERSSARA